MAISLPSGFIVTNQQPIDARLVLTRAEMVAALDARMPEQYLCVCKDDGLIYIYNVNNSVDAETGKFRKLESGTKLATEITLGEEITSQIEVGGITKGKTYSATDSVSLVINDLLGNTSPSPSDGKLYYGVGSTIPTDVTGMTAVEVSADSLKANGYIWEDITLNNEYPLLAIDNALGISCYEILQNGFALGYQTVELGDQILYYLDNRGTDTNVRLTYHFK